MHWVGDASNHLILCCPLLLLPSILPSIRVFSMSQFFTSDGQSIRASASASVLQMNILDGFPLEFTGLFPLQSKGLSRVFYSTTVQRHQKWFSAFFMVQLSHPYMTTGKTIPMTIWPSLSWISKKIWNQSIDCPMSGSNSCFMTCIQISQEPGKAVWYSHLLKNFPQFFCDPHSQMLSCRQLSRSFSGILLLFIWSKRC